MDFTHILTQLGFNDKETTIYLAALELGMAPVSIIAKKAGLKRPTAHEILAKLSSKGLAERFLKNKMRYYGVISPAALHEKYLNHLRQLAKTLPQMMAIHNQLVKKPRITFYEGKADLKRLYLDVLNSNNEILNYFLPDKAYEYFGRQFVDLEHIAARVKKGLTLRAIMPNSRITKEYVSRSDRELRQIRMIQDIHMIFTNEVYLYDDKMSIFSFDEDFALLIQSRDVLQTQKIMFELAWNSTLVFCP